MGRVVSRFNGKRGIFTGEGSQGGELSTSSWFKGENVGIFGGIEYFSSRIKGLRAKLSMIQQTTLQKEIKPQNQDSEINFSAIYNISDNFSVLQVS